MFESTALRVGVTTLCNTTFLQSLTFAVKSLQQVMRDHFSKWFVSQQRLAQCHLVRSLFECPLLSSSVQFLSRFYFAKQMLAYCYSDPFSVWDYTEHE